MSNKFAVVITILVFSVLRLFSQTEPEELRLNEMKHLEEVRIYYKNGTEEELFKDKKNYKYNRKKDELQVEKEKEQWLNIKWIEKDSLTQVYEYYRSLDSNRSDLYLLKEIKFEDGLKKSKTILLPVQNINREFGAEYVPLEEDMGFEKKVIYEVNKDQLFSKIPTRLKDKDTSQIFQIQLEFTTENNKRITGVYSNSSKGETLYWLNYIDVVESLVGGEYIIYTLIYKRNRNDFQLVTKRGYDKNDQIIKYYGVDITSEDRVVDRRYKYDRRGNWREMRAYQNSKLSEFISRKIKYYRKNKT